MKAPIRVMMSVVMILAFAEFSQIHRIRRRRADPLETTFRTLLQLQVFLIQKLKTTAAMVPKRSSITPLIAITKSEYPQGLMRKLQFVAKQIRLPYPMQYAKKNVQRLRSPLICLRDSFIEEFFSAVAPSDGATSGPACINNRQRIKQIPDRMKYAKQRCPIAACASSPTVSSLTTRVGTRKPMPMPMRLIPTISDVAKALQAKSNRTFFGKNQLAATFAGEFSKKGWPRPRKTVPTMTKLKLLLTKEQQSDPMKQKEVPMMSPTLSPFESMILLAGKLAMKKTRRLRMTDRDTLVSETAQIAVILCQRGVTALFVSPLSTRARPKRATITHRQGVS